MMPVQGASQPHREDSGRCPTKPSVRVVGYVTVVDSRGPYRSPPWDPALPLTSRVAKYYKLENGSEYRTLLKAFGIRFDVLVYGNVSPCAGLGVEGRKPRPPLGPQEAPLGDRVQPPALKPSAGLTSSLHTMKGRGLLHLFLSGWESQLNLWPHLCPAAGFSVHSPWSLYIQAGKFNIIPTIISSVAAFTSVGVVSSAPPGCGRQPVWMGPQLVGVGRKRTQVSQGGDPCKLCFGLE